VSSRSSGRRSGDFTFLAPRGPRPISIIAGASNERIGAERPALARAISRDRFMPGRSSGLFGAWKDRRLQQGGELISFNFAIAKNCREQSGTDRLTRMNRHDGSTAVGMTKEVMAALDSNEWNPTFLNAAITSRPVTLGRRVTPL
jgi:hypothetical protein